MGWGNHPKLNFAGVFSLIKSFYWIMFHVLDHSGVSIEHTIKFLNFIGCQASVRFQSGGFIPNVIQIVLKNIGFSTGKCAVGDPILYPSLLAINSSL